MKSKKRSRYIIAAIPILFVLMTVTLLAVKYYAAYRYIKNCLYSDKDELEQLADIHSGGRLCKDRRGKRSW